MEYYSAIKRNTFESVQWMNLEPIIQSEVSQKEREISYANAYIWNIYMESIKINLFVRQQCRNRHREQTYGHTERGGEGEMYGETNMDTYITICKMDSQRANGNLLFGPGNSNGLCINLEGWDGERDGREFQKGGDICIPMWFMLRLDRKQQNSVKQLSFNKK